MGAFHTTKETSPHSRYPLPPRPHYAQTQRSYKRPPPSPRHTSLASLPPFAVRKCGVGGNSY
ncbi:hypothetical protein BU23DRAFT_557354 [Bimuria novae-zelandiae CBS 107.79]|uniref:Uncharacterized protein n=1 Tax=Bimuria novae-zelandiae CBS 107.79 TaxID=1447943 RepID=A0A6A5V0J2_9PLEO|nr:hypothetical protein BU23DRAFT_557354 [Bimuria novae-zelandiae CBS 107.79]